MLNTIIKIAERHIYLTTTLLSLLVSIGLFASRDIISRDAILYTEGAQAFLEHGFMASFKVWGWPFYSILLAIIHKITGFSFELSAYFLTIILETVISVTFVKLYSKVAFNDARLWVAMLFILTFATFNDYKADIWREYGFWAFGLIAIYQFVLYFQERKITNAILWQISICATTLFRVEGIVFVVLAPFYFLLISSNGLAEKIKNVVTLNSIFYSAGLLAVFVVLSSTQLQELILNNLPPQIVYLSPSDIFGHFDLAADNFIKYVLPFDYSADYTHFMLASGLIAMLVYKLINNLTVVYFGIWLTGIYKGWINNKKELQIIYYFAFLALLILLIFILSRLFVSTRYTVFLLLLIGLIFTQHLDYLLSYLSRQPRKIWLTVLLTFISFQFLDSVITTGAKKTPIKQSSEWLVQQIKPEDKIACNEKRFAYYSKHKCLLSKKYLYKNYKRSDVKRLKKNNFRYLLLWVNHKNKKMLNALEEDNNLKLLKSFKNKKGDAGLVFQILND